MINPQTVLQFKKFMNNPQAMLQKMGIPQGMQNNPQAIIQYLMDNGKLTQEDYNRAIKKAGEFQKMLNI